MVLNSNDLYVSGLSKHYTGSQWIPIYPTIFGSLAGTSDNLYGARSSECTGGAHFDGTHWTCLDLGIPISIKKMEVAGDGSVFLLSQKGMVIKKVGPKIQVLQDRGCTQIDNIAATDNGGVYIICREGSAYVNNGGSWETVWPLYMNRYVRICGVGDTLYAANGDEMLWFDGREKHTYPSEQQVSGLFCSPGGAFSTSNRNLVFRVKSDGLESLPALPGEWATIMDIVQGGTKLCTHRST